MRDAFTAQPDDDFDLPAVVRPRPSSKAPSKPRRSAAKPQRKPGAGERLAAFALSHPRQLVAALFLTGCGGVIAWNALVLQSAHHPAPLFSQKGPAPAPAPDYAPAPAYSQPLPPARPGVEFSDAQAPAPASHQAPTQAPAAPAVSTPRLPSRGAIADMIRNGGEPAPAAQAASRPAQATASAMAAAPSPNRAPTVRDPIAEIIRLGGPVPTPPANVGRADSGDLVLAGQRALARLGYGVKADGLMGAGTRQAIERFEQDRRLPVTGEFSGRTARELSALSGIAVQ